ncbi:hypothetical protein [Mesorhizobium sp. 8]|uniref:hypothetical protein n=1 Tax=Mesorhizobium sp. 8 TaxID=2584466 RepID=UPI00111F5160|nr:hypothetical protein [Mesorhizobium sp. 8]QDB99302.1 hypothetical protein FGU64_02135 [Mesorhizobium sp. 8]
MNPKVPRFEPEVIAAASRRWHGDDEKVATTSIKCLDVDGVQVSSRYGKAAEYDIMAAMVLGVEAGLRTLIETIWCDSKACACYSVTLRSCTAAQAKDISYQLEEACISLSGGHNGIDISGERGGYIVLDPNWGWGDVES